MGRELDYIIKNEELVKSEVLDFQIIKFINLASGLQDNKLFDIFETLKLQKVIFNLNYDGEITDVIDREYYESLNISSHLEYLLSLNFPKYITKFLTDCLNKGYNLGYNNINKKLYAINNLETTSKLLLRYDVLSDEAELLFDGFSYKDFMRAVDKLYNIYGVSLYPVLHSYEDMPNYEDLGKFGIKEELFKINDRSIRLSSILKHCIESNTDLIVNDEYSQYYVFILWHLTENHSFVYSY